MPLWYNNINKYRMNCPPPCYTSASFTAWGLLHTTKLLDASLCFSFIWMASWSISSPGAGHTFQWLSIKSVRLAFYDYTTVISKPNRCSHQHLKVTQRNEWGFSKALLHRVLRTSCLVVGRGKMRGRWDNLELQPIFFLFSCIVSWYTASKLLWPLNLLMGFTSPHHFVGQPLQGMNLN